MHIYKRTSLLVALVCSLAMFSAFASSPAATTPNPSPSPAKVDTPIYSSGNDIIIKWSAVNDSKYSIIVFDLKEKKNIVSSKISDKVLVISGNLFTKAASYKVTVIAIDSNNKVIKTFTNYFHIQKVVVTPSGKTTPKNLITSLSNKTGDNKKVTLSTLKPVTTPTQTPSATPTSSPKAAATNGRRNPSATPRPQSDMPNYLRDNPFFKDKNSNNEDLWFNDPLNDQFFIDADFLAESDRVAFVGIDFKKESDTFKAVNSFRKTNGLSELVWNDNLARMSRVRAMAHVYEAVGNDHNLKVIGGMPNDSMRLWGLYPEAGEWRENICWASSKDGSIEYRAKDFLEIWIESSEHLANMRRDANQIGFGVILSEKIQEDHIGYDVAFISAK